MKAALLALALLSSCLLSVSAGSARRLAQAPAPAGCTTVYEAAEGEGLTQFIAAADADDLKPYLDSPDLGYTILAPTNAAFEAFLSQENSTFEKLADAGVLDTVLQYHFLPKPYTEAQLSDAGVLESYTNLTLTFGSDGEITDSSGNEAQITRSDITACKSIVHVISHVLIPSEVSDETASS